MRPAARHANDHYKVARSSDRSSAEMREECHGRYGQKARRLELVVPAVCDPVRRGALATLYNSAAPAVMGIPFFYWFQLAMVLVGAVLTAVVYFATED